MRNKSIELCGSNPKLKICDYVSKILCTCKYACAVQQIYKTTPHHAHTLLSTLIDATATRLNGIEHKSPAWLGDWSLRTGNYCTV